jgi:acetyl-CoA synthetase
MEEKVYPVPAQWRKRAWVDDAAYRKMYAESIRNPESFWRKHARRLDWFRAPKKIKNSTYGYPDVSIRW